MTKKFIVTCAARTGSTMLRYLLNSHPEILCHGEIFRRKGIGALEGQHGEKYLEDIAYQEKLNDYFYNDTPYFIKHIVYDSDDHPVIGFKFKTDEYFGKHLTFKKVAAYLKADKEIFVINLKRRDLLAQYVSHQIVLQQNSATVKFDNQQDRIQPVFIKQEQLLRFLNTVQTREHQIVEEMVEHPIIEVWYEDILTPQSDSLVNIQSFLNVEPKLLSTSTKKIITDYKNLILNLEEILPLFESESLVDRKPIA